MTLVSSIEARSASCVKRARFSTADERGLRDRQPTHLLLDRAIAVAQLQPHALEGWRRHHALHFEALALRAGRVLVEQLPGGLAQADHPGLARVAEAGVEELLYQLAVRVVAREAEAHDAELLATRRGERDGVFLLGVAGRAARLAGERRGECPKLRTGAVARLRSAAGVRPGLEAQRLEAHARQARLGQRLADRLGPAFEQQLGVHGPRRLERPAARRLLEVLLDVIEQLLCLAQQAELQVLGLLRDRVEGQYRECDRRQQHGTDEDRYDPTARIRNRGQPPGDVGHASINLPPDASTGARRSAAARG